MEIKLNENILKVQTSKIRQFNDYAKSVGVDTVMTLGEPDFNTPTEITQSAIAALEDHQTKYGPTPGFWDLRKEICQFEEKFNHFICTPDEILITHGSTEALTSAIFTMLNPNDEVIVPIPAYPMYRQMIEYCQGVVVTIDTTSTHFQITRKQLEEAITPKTKAIILTSPNNPTGTIYTQETLHHIYEAVKDLPIFIICDDVYNQIVFGKREIGFVQFHDLKDRIIVCQSFSKSYAMPGWRCGYMIANADFCKQAMKIHQYMIVALNTFIQPAMKVALSYDNRQMIESYKKRRDYIYRRLKQMNLEVEKPQGAFYIFPSIRPFHLSSTEFCRRFASEYKVAIIPGDCFEADDFIRLSFCVDMNTIKTACDRLEQFLRKLKEQSFTNSALKNF